MPKPMVTLLVQRKGKYVDDDAVLVGMDPGDATRSRSRVSTALRRCGIDPTAHGLGTFRLTFDPAEVSESQAVAVVSGALRSGGVSVRVL